jgi:uncharacterized membrane protein
MINFSNLCLLAISQLTLAAGQVFLKFAADSGTSNTDLKPRRTGWFIAGIASMSIWFLVWIHLMRVFELNRLFAFEGVSPILVAAASALFLAEKITVQAWLASVLIGAGIVLVAVF